MNLSERRIFFNGCAFNFPMDVYEPAEDTFLLAEHLVLSKIDTVLDIGTGCGILGILAAKKARKVVATDLNPQAVHCAKTNAKFNGVSEKMDYLAGDLFQPVKKTEKFDLVIFNAPYLPSQSELPETWIGRAWAGGPSGRLIIDRFLAEAKHYLKRAGRVLLVQSSLSNVSKTLGKLEEAGMWAKVIAERKVAFETIVVIEAKRRARAVVQTDNQNIFRRREIR